jgi:alkylation response protein AidB-like acyl-CoA dehydrogenase
LSYKFFSFSHETQHDFGKNMNSLHPTPLARDSYRSDIDVLDSKPITPGDPSIAARILADVTSYIPQLRARALETEKLGRIPDETIRDLDAMGVFKMVIPVEYGGYASTPLQIYDVITEIACGCGSTGWVSWVTMTGTQWLGLYNHQFQDEVFASGWVGPLSCGAGSPGAARRVPGGIMLKGKWPWGSGCQHAATVHLGAICPEDENPEPLLALVRQDQVTILDDWKVMGMRGSSSNTMVIEDEIFVPDHHIRTVKDVFSTNRIEPARAGLLFQMNLVSLTSTLHAAVSIGIARAAVELFREKIQTRRMANSRYEKQSDAPVTHLQLGELHCKLQAAELMARNNVGYASKRAEDGLAPDELELKRSVLESAYVMKLCSEITELVLRASGASSIREESPFQRLFRDSRVATLHAFTIIETCYEDFGRASLGLGTSTALNKSSLA